MAERRQLLHPDIEPAIDAWLAARGLTWRALERGDVKLGDQLLTASDIQLMVILADPVYFVESFFVERDGPRAGHPWELWPYQRQSMRYRGSTVHECGAEVGKSREILGLAVWWLLGCGPRSRGDQLICASQDGHLESLHVELVHQLRATPHLAAQIDWDRSKVKPYRVLVAKNGNRLEMRPAGYDGEALRGLHVGLAAYFDEAAKVKNPRCFDEFFRAVKPGAETRIYSTPDGDRSSVFFRLCNQAPAVPIRTAEPPPTPGRSLSAAPGPFSPPADGKAIRFRWPKTLMPPPYWTEERRRQLIDRYGGVDSPGYQQLVLGNWGDPAATVFPWEQFVARVRHVSEYLVARLLWNAPQRTVQVSVSRLDPTYQIGARTGDEAATGPQPLLPVLDRELDAANFDLAGLLTSIFQPLPGHLVAGIDCGASDDPTEILLWETRGELARCVARLQLKRFDYPAQRTAVRVLDQLFRPSHGWGLDATGVGSALEHLLREGEEGWSLDGRVTGYVFNARVADRNPETGEAIEDPATGRFRQVSAKEMATRILEQRIQRARIEFPADPEFLSQFPSHTAEVGSSGQRVFRNTGDHIIDASRVAMLRLFDLEHGDGAAPPVLFHVPRGLGRRPAMEAFA